MHICSGPMMAAVDTFWFRIQGQGGHGAVPHLAIDPITLAAQVISFMQTIVSRRIDPLEPAVLTLASIHSGSANNIIPESADVTGTIRTFKPDLRNMILREMENILKGITEAQGASYALELTTSYPSVNNDAGMVRVMSCAFAKILGEDHIDRHMVPIMVSEDFAYYTKNVPSAFAFIGIARDKDHPVSHHHPRFQWDDRNLKILAGGLAQTALDFLGSR